MTWPLGQVLMFTKLPRLAGGAGTTNGGVGGGRVAFRRVVGRRAPDFFLAMEHAGDLVLRRGDDAIGFADQQVLRPFAAEKAIGRCKPVSNAPIVFLPAK